MTTKKQPRTKVTANMAPEGGVTYPYANPNYSPGEVDPSHDWRYTGPSLTERVAAEMVEAGLEWRGAGPGMSYRWLPKEEAPDA